MFDSFEDNLDDSRRKLLLSCALITANNTCGLSTIYMGVLHCILLYF